MGMGLCRSAMVRPRSDTSMKVVSAVVFSSWLLLLAYGEKVLDLG